MNEHQRFALEHPLNEAFQDWELIGQLARQLVIPGGNILQVVLAVDR